jgi:hypothetical protein
VGVLPSKQLAECRQLLWMIMMLQQHEQPCEAGVKGLPGLLDVKCTGWKRLSGALWWDVLHCVHKALRRA